MKDESLLTNWFISSDSIIINNSHEERHTLEERKLINIKGRMDVEGRGEAYLYSLISKGARLCIATVSNATGNKIYQSENSYKT